MQTRYQMIADDITGSPLMTLEEVRAAHTPTDKTGGYHLREELRGQPCFKGYCGPMWGGYLDEDGNHCHFRDNVADEGKRETYGSQKPVAYVVVRYETWPAYDRLSA